MPVATVRAVLVAASAVTDLVPATRIEPLRRTQSLAVPAITLQRVSTVPFNHLRGDGDLDANLVQLDVIAGDYTAARLIATACRNALQDAAARHVMQSEIDGYESETDPELYRITQTWSVFT